MKVFTISGSVREESANNRLLQALPAFFKSVDFEQYRRLHLLPVFTAEQDKHPWPEEVMSWRNAAAGADALVFCTPEYIHNLPAILKNALEWVTSSGELYQKPVLPITFTPNSPRGEKAMTSLTWSLQALDARIIAQLALYQNELTFDDEGDFHENESTEMLEAALQMLTS